jgi:hypothetical protein
VGLGYGAGVEWSGRSSLRRAAPAQLLCCSGAIAKLGERLDRLKLAMKRTGGP